MELSYKTTIEDYVAFSQYMLRKSRVGRVNYFAGWLFLPGAGVLAAATLVWANGMVVEALICFSASALYAGLYPIVHRYYIKIYVRDYAKALGTRGVLGPIRLVLNDESLVEITERTRSEARWRDIEGVDEIDGYTFIMVTGLTAAILPRRGFEDERDYERASHYAKERWNSSHLRDADSNQLTDSAQRD
jgi:hypothetical protein